MRRGLLRLAYRVASPLAHAWWGLWGSHHDGAKCVILNAGEVLLVRHTYGDRRRWDFPGGLVRRGEEPIAGAAREMQEELGLVLGRGDLRDLGPLALRIGRRWDTVHYFEVEVPDRTLQPETVELAEVAWFRSAELPRPLGEQVELALTWISPSEGVSIAGNRSGESRPGLRGRRSADPQT